jgi:hypothetical protein
MAEQGSGWRTVGRRHGATSAAAQALMLGVVVFLPCLHGCAVVRAAHGIEGADISAVRVGVTRAEVELRLGSPVRQWTTSSAIEYRMYRYDAGVPGSSANATAMVLGEISTLGLLELIVRIPPPPQAGTDPSRLRNIAVAYDQSGIAVGVFIDVGDLEQLPEDGKRSNPPPR